MNAMTEDPALAVDRPPIDGAVTLPIHLVQASATNPRKHFDPAKLAELGESIRKHGLMQPILVRPRTGARRGEPLYELVAGERRWRASKLINEEFIDAIVRDMSDFEVVELQLIENLQRSDLTALEEADGYHQLLARNDKFMGLKVEELCARIGKSRSHVFQRLKLRELGEAGRMALEAAEITPSVALLIARLPTEDDQKRATQHVVQGWGGEPMSFRNAQAWIEREFMLQLSRAPFKITDASLVPTAGSCRDCPKRTGANPDLFDDIKDGDTCTDAACYHGKEDAHRARLKAQAEEAGTKVISGSEAKKAMPTSYGGLKGFFKLDEPVHEISSKPLAKLLGKDAPEVVLIENPHTKDLVRVVREDEAMKALKAKGLVKTSRVPTTSASEREAEARRKVENKVRAEIGARLMDQIEHAAAEAEFCDLVIRSAARTLYKELGNDGTEAIERLMQWEHIGSEWQDPKNAERKRARFDAMTNTQLLRFFAAASVVGELKVGGHLFGPNGKAPESRFLEPLATAAGVDVARIRAEFKAEAKEKAKTPETALAAAVKKAAKKKGVKVSEIAPAAQLSAAAADPFREA